LGPEDGQLRSPWARGGCFILMAQARPLFFGAVLLALVLPGHPLAPLSGLPLDLPALVAVLLVAGRAIALPRAPLGAAPLAGAVAAVAMLKASVGWLAPAYGVDGAYRLDNAAVAVQDGWPTGDSVDRTLEFRGDAFPVHFLNNVRYLNFYTPTEPKRDLLPFT